MGFSGLVSAGFVVTSLIAHQDTGLLRGTHTHAHAHTHSRCSSRLHSQLSQKQIQDMQERYLDPLLQKAGLSLDGVSVEKLSNLGFANNVFRIVVDVADHNNHAKISQILVAKIFSELAKKRVDPHQHFMGEVDELLYTNGIGPRVIAHTPDALLMEYIEGQVLTEKMIFDDKTGKQEGLSICRSVGKCLGRMHTLPGNGGPNRLWHSMDVLLSSVDETSQLSTDQGNLWSLGKLQDTVGSYRNQLEGLDVRTVQVGHGDFKLSNVMITDTVQEIKFIDFELSGTHYRGYDLAKFFRSAKESSIEQSTFRYHQRAFWESYCQHIELVNNDHSILSEAELDKTVTTLEWEAQLLEPMTWLEAASFFLSMAALDDPMEKDKWETLARSRLSSFESTRLAVNS